jgi:hypothetical protein
VGRRQKGSQMPISPTTYNILPTIPMLSRVCIRICILYIYIIHAILPANAACCPDINIEDVVLLNKIGEGLGFKV